MALTNTYSPHPPFILHAN